VGGLLVLLAIGLGALIAWRITASITAPIGRAVVVAERIARGDLTSQVEVRIHDETGRLLEAIAAISETGGDVDNRPTAYRLHGSILVIVWRKGV
jgi:methyl-accepting chemotaxis protein